MSEALRQHYRHYPYPVYPLLATIPRPDTYAINLTALWCRFNGRLPPPEARRILLAGCGTFSPYPWALANPGERIVALDLSEASLRRARAHALLHGCRNIEYRCGDLLDDTGAAGTYGLIDAFGVLHHLDDPLAGLRTLSRRLLPGGIIRVMLYSRYARREEESIRRALRLLGIREPADVRRLLDRAAPDSRLARFRRASDELRSTAGIADALLHPCVRTFRVDECLDLFRSAGLVPLRFAHGGALADPDLEAERLRGLEKERRAPGNFIAYLGRPEVPPPPHDRPGAHYLLNPCLAPAVRHGRFGTVHIPGRLGTPNPPLGPQERAFLRRFRTPVAAATLDEAMRRKADRYLDPIFLLYYC